MFFIIMKVGVAVVMGALHLYAIWRVRLRIIGKKAISSTEYLIYTGMLTLWLIVDLWETQAYGSGPDWFPLMGVAHIVLATIVVVMALGGFHRDTTKKMVVSFEAKALAVIMAITMILQVIAPSTGLSHLQQGILIGLLAMRKAKS